MVGMRQKHGCPPGSFSSKNRCIIAGSLPHIGTQLVPSIENRQGCEIIDGYWDKGVCIKEDHIDYGATAPLKGAVFDWTIYDTEEEQIKNPPSDMPPKKYLGIITGYLALEDDSYIFGEKYYDDDFSLLGDFLRGVLIDATKDIKNGKANIWGLGYFTKYGAPAAHNSRDAIVANDGKTVREAYYYIDKWKQKEKNKQNAFYIKPRGRI